MSEPLKVAIFSSKILLKHKFLAFLRNFDAKYRKLNFKFLLQWTVNVIKKGRKYFVLDDFALVPK